MAKIIHKAGKFAALDVGSEGSNYVSGILRTVSKDDKKVHQYKVIGLHGSEAEAVFATKSYALAEAKLDVKDVDGRWYNLD